MQLYPPRLKQFGLGGFLFGFISREKRLTGRTFFTKEQAMKHRTCLAVSVCACISLALTAFAGTEPLPNGKEMKLRVRKEEADQVRHLEQMDGMHTYESPQKMKEGYLEWLKTIQT